MNIYSTFHKSSPVGIESRKTNILPNTPPRIEFIQSYASLKRDVRRYKRIALTLLIMFLICLVCFAFAYSKLIDMRDAYIMHNYTYHYEGRHTTAPPLTWNTWSNVKEGER